MQVRLHENGVGKLNGSILRATSAGVWVHFSAPELPGVQKSEECDFEFVEGIEILGQGSGVVTALRESGDGLDICFRFLVVNEGGLHIPDWLRGGIENRTNMRLSPPEDQPLEVDCTREAGGSPFLGAVEDISFGGACISSKDDIGELAMGDQLMIRLSLPGVSRVATVAGQLRHMRRVGRVAYLGLQFLPPTCQATEVGGGAVQAYVKELHSKRRSVEIRNQ